MAGERRLPENTNNEIDNTSIPERRSRRKLVGGAAAGAALAAVGIVTAVQLTQSSEHTPKSSPDTSLESAGPNMYVGREIIKGENLPCFEGTAVIQQTAADNPRLTRKFAVYNPPVAKKDGHLLVAIGTDHETATPQHVKFEYVDVMGDSSTSIQTRFALLPGSEHAKIIPCAFNSLRRTKDSKDQINMVPSTHTDSKDADLTTAAGRKEAGAFALPVDPETVHGNFAQGPQVASALIQELDS
jgi:hypothetical protein